MGKKKIKETKRKSKSPPRGRARTRSLTSEEPVKRLHVASE
ncbi:hypothetical protein [Natronincola peptidivorans]|nr:hypothetical protein [Natronincola peptidivorans]